MTDATLTPAPLRQRQVWTATGWKHVIAWLYTVMVGCDFIIFPIAWPVFQVREHITPVTAWVPITLGGGGLIHLAICGVLGIQLWRRGDVPAQGND